MYSIQWETSRRIYAVRGESDKTEATPRPDHSWPELWRGMSKNAKLREKHKWALKNQSSIMQEDYEESISLTLRTWSSRKSFKMQEENWKHQWLQPCLVRFARKTSMVRPVARLLISKSKFACILEASESTRMRMEETLPKYHEDHIAGKRRQFTTALQYGTHLFLCLKQ